MLVGEDEGVGVDSSCCDALGEAGALKHPVMNKAAKVATRAAFNELSLTMAPRWLQKILLPWKISARKMSLGSRGYVQKYRTSLKTLLASRDASPQVLGNLGLRVIAVTP